MCQGQDGFVLLGPDPAKLICYQQDHWRKTLDRNQVLVKTQNPAATDRQLCGMADHSTWSQHHCKQRAEKAAQAEHQSPNP